MTIKTNNNPVLRPTTNDNREKPVWDTDHGKRWSSAVACAEELHIDVRRVYSCCNHRTHTCAGLHLSYEEDVVGTQTGMATTLSALSAEAESMRAELARLREIEKLYKKEQAAKTTREEALASAEKLVAHRQHMYDEAKSRADYALERLEEAQKKLDDIKNWRS